MSNNSQLYPEVEFIPATRFLPATRALFELPVNRLSRVGRSLQALTTTFAEGIDVSKWQPSGTINWVVLRDGGVSWVAIKASEGETIVDQAFIAHCEGALSAGLHVMPYHFFRSNLGGVAQAEHFMSTIMPLLDMLGYVPPLWVDIETVDGTSNANRINRLQSCLSQLSSMSSPDRPGVYTSPGFANTSLTPVPSYINAYHHWIAHWTSASLPTSPAGWSTTNRKLWQYGVWNDHSWCQPVPGCIPDIDRDKFFGDEAALSTFIGAPPPPTLDERVTVLELEARAHGWDV